MTPVPAGILLPQSVLSSPWFILLATVVAFNTIIYLGLTLSKLIPWPRQIHPSRVRRWLLLLGIHVDEDTAVNQIRILEPPGSDNPYEDMRGSIARRDIPQAFGLVGILVVLLSVAALLAFGDSLLTNHLMQFAAGVLFLLVAQVLGHRSFRARAVMWTWAGGCVLLVFMMVAEAAQQGSQLPLAYGLIVMTAFAPVTLAWRPSLAAGAVMLVSLVAASLIIEGEEDYRLIAAGVAALLTSATLLRLRLVAIDALSDEEARSRALATTDPLTGALTRQGLLTLLPGMAATADRAGQQVCLMLFDVEQLATANEQYGMHYGDDVLRAVASAIHRTVRQGDLVARWGGDEFVVAGLGGRPSAEALAARIQEAVRASGVNLGKWPTQVSVATTAGDPQQTTFDAMLAEVSA